MYLYSFQPHSAQGGGRSSFTSFNPDNGRSFDFTPGFVRGQPRVSRTKYYLEILASQRYTLYFIIEKKPMMMI